ncbi:MAG: ABC transporter ATP-binding protein [Flavobacteriaceae bacterium]|nr:ABC transporter ATP-binding protein [Flavobacteriaceae bacterium]
MINISLLSKKYGDQTVLNIDELHIPSGQTFGLVGNNGAGKTTLFSLILDLISPSTGHVKNNGVVVADSEAWKPNTAAFIDEQFLIGYLTPEEYFYFIGGLREIKKDVVTAALTTYEDFFHGEVLGQKKYIRDLSKGNQKKVGIVAALLSNTPVVILDEPFANLDPTTQIRLKNLLKEEASTTGKTFLISSHDLQHVTEVCDRIVVLNKGKIVRDEQTSPTTLQELELFFREQL